MRILGIAFTLVLLMSLVGCTLSHRNCRHHHHLITGLAIHILAVVNGKLSDSKTKTFH